MLLREEPHHEEHDWLRVTLASIGDGVMTTDANGRITFINPVAESLTGWTLDAAMGVAIDRVFKVIDAETRHTVENPASRALREGLVVGLASRPLLIAKDGTERPVDGSAAAVRNATGEVAGVVLVFRDVTERGRAEGALRDSEERFRLLVEGVQDYAIFQLDPHGTVVSWNAGAERIKGYRGEEIIGKHFSCFYTPDELARGWPEQLLGTAAAEGRVADEGWRVRKDGSRLWASVVITALRDAAGNLKGFAKISRDLTDRMLAERALRTREERFRALTQSATDAIISADEHGSIITWNAAATHIFGYSEEEAVGHPLTLLMPERYRDAHRSGFARLQATGETRVVGRTVELHGKRKDGSEFPLELSLAAWRADQGQCYSGIVRDISARQQLERAKGQAELLADENRRKDQFLAVLAHELRSPLAPIVNAVHLLGIAGSDHERIARCRDMIERQVRHLTRIVDDLLDVSRIIRGNVTMRRERLDLARLVRQGAEDRRGVLRQSAVALQLEVPETPVWVTGDPTRLSQVLGNVLDNAAKFTPAGGQVTVGLTADDRARQTVVTIRDTGIGIEPDVLPAIFEVFAQAKDSLERSRGGMGLGLSVAKGLVELHGGSIAAMSHGSGQGTEFTIRLPLEPEPAAVAVEPVSARPAAHDATPRRT